MPSGVVAVNSGLMPNGSRAPNSTRSSVSQIRKANMPRSRVTAALPQWWKPATMASPSPSVRNSTPCSATSSSRSSQVVVDLAVEDQRIPVGRFRRPPAQRLVGVLEVDDRQPVEAEDDVAVVPGPGLVRPAVPGAPHAGGHLLRSIAGSAGPGQEAHQSAHWVGHLISSAGERLFPRLQRAACPVSGSVSPRLQSARHSDRYRSVPTGQPTVGWVPFRGGRKLVPHTVLPHLRQVVDLREPRPPCPGRTGGRSSNLGADRLQ